MIECGRLARVAIVGLLNRSAPDRRRPAKSMPKTSFSRTPTMCPSPITRWRIRSLTAHCGEFSPALPSPLRSTPCIALSARHSVRGCRPPPDRDSAGRRFGRCTRRAYRRARYRRAVSTRRPRATPQSGVALRRYNGWPACVRFRGLATRGPPMPHPSARRAGYLWRGGKATYAGRRSTSTGVGPPNRGHHASGGRGVMPPD